MNIEFSGGPKDSLVITVKEIVKAIAIPFWHGGQYVYRDTGCKNGENKIFA